MPESKQPSPHLPAGGGWLSRERALAHVLIAATALAFYVCYRLALPFLPALTCALVLAVVAHPLHEAIAKRFKNPNASAGLSVAVVAVLIVTPALFLARQLVSQAARGAEALT
jgi:predicted PurR-regulated permease PerM